MTITPTTLTRGAAVAAMAAGTIFIGVQIGHPHLDAGTVDTTQVLVRDALKIVMAALALAGITGMYLRQVRQMGLLGLIGYLLFSSCYLVVLSTVYTALCVLPTIAENPANTAYVNDVTAVATNGHAVGDIGLLQQAIQIQGIGYLAGGLLFGVALYRAGILSRWASALLAVGGVVSVALSLMPDAFYRLLAFPNGIALIGLGWSLWVTTRSTPSAVAEGEVASLSTTSVGAA